MSTGHPPVGATTHYPQRSIFSAPILEHRPARSDQQPCMARSEQHQQQQQQSTHNTAVQSQSVHPAQSAQATHSHSVHPSQSAQQASAAAPPVDSASPPEDSSQQATSRIKPAASGFMTDPATVSIQPSSQTPFNVVTSGESGHLLNKQRQSNPCPAVTADKQRMGPPVVDGFTAQVSPFVAQSEHSLHIQQAPNHQAPHSDAVALKTYNPGLSGRSGSYTYGSNYPQPSFIHSGNGQPGQDHNNSHCYPGSNMQSHLSSQGSAGFTTMPQSMPQYPYSHHQYQPQQQMHHASWSGYEEVRTSPRHPGAWNWSDGAGQNHMNGLNQSGSTNWDSQQAQSSQFSMPSQPDWQEQQPWNPQQSDASGGLSLFSFLQTHRCCCKSALSRMFFALLALSASDTS